MGCRNHTLNFYFWIFNAFVIAAKIRADLISRVIKYLSPITSVSGPRNWHISSVSGPNSFFNYSGQKKKKKTIWTCSGLCMSSIGTRKINLNRNFLNPETDISQFLGPDTDIMGNRYFIRPWYVWKSCFILMKYQYVEWYFIRLMCRK